MNEIDAYNKKQDQTNKEICELLNNLINEGLSGAESKIWHGHPVWFIDGNPIVGYSVRKAGVNLMFWSGRSFDEPELSGVSRFKDASIAYTTLDNIDSVKIAKWLDLSTKIQWDYKNIVKRKGKLVKLK